MDDIKDKCAAVLDGQKILLQKGMEDFKKERVTQLNSFDKKIVIATSVQNSKSKDLDKQQLELAHKINQVATLKVEDMEQAAIDIMSDVDIAVSAHLNTESMQTTLKTQATEIFNKMCDETNPEVIDRLEGTGKEILTNDIWVTKHIQAIATEAMVY